MQGHIFQINTSAGGVPKMPIREGVVAELGFEGDVQKNTKHHGGPDKALCLYSLETILRLQQEGHPIYPGSTGENLTLTGIDFDQLEAGTRLRLGADVLIEVTYPAVPCTKISASFKDGHSKRIAEDLSPGDSRLYARVLQGGPLRIGDPVRIDPARD